ncbi:MAG: nucleoside triphosphate pyrophosphatase [Bacteriovoracaceae bacterium]
MFKNLGKDQSLMTYPLILASTSIYRKKLLSQLGWEFKCVGPEVDEDSLKQTNLSPSEIAHELSKLKARAVFNLHPDSCVIGSDQVCALDNKILSKPKSLERAIEQLSELQGRTHVLVTAVTIICPKAERTFINRTELKMRPLTRDNIISYLETDKPFDCAGSYKLEEQGIKLFEKIQMTDHTAIIGLPLIELANNLIELGYHLS